MADCSLALPLIQGIAAECLLADKAYDTNEIIATAWESGMNPVIPPKSNRREKRDYDRALYKLRHLVENGFLEFKQWRGVATRYAKRTASYLAACLFRARFRNRNVQPVRFLTRRITGLFPFSR